MWQSGMQNAEGAGLSAGLHIPNPFLKQQYFTDIWNAEQFAVGMQVLELAFKQEKKFDWKAILTAALQATANDVMSLGLPETKKDITEDINKDVTQHLAEQMPLTFVDDFITQEVYNHRFDGELAAANATGSFAGNLAALSAYQYFSNKNSQKDQKPQKHWQNEKRKINRDEKDLSNTTQKINAELAALGNINPFTGEPLDSGVTNNSQMGNDSSRMRQAQSGPANDPTANNTNKNPSYNNRQAQHDASVNRAQRWSDEQQKRNEQGGFLSSIGKGFFEGAKDAFTFNFSDKNNMHGRWQQWGYAAGLLGGFVGGIASGQDAKLAAAKAIEIAETGAKVEKVTSEEANFYSKAKLISQNNLYNPGMLDDLNASTFIGNKYNTYLLNDDMVLFRAGEKDNPLGQFMSFERPNSELQVRIDKAILPKWSDGSPSVINTGYAIKIPKGTYVHIGEVAQQGGIFLGGTKQIFIEKP